MTPLELNEQGFEGDKFLKEEFQRLIDKHGIISIIETGTYLGNTTAQLATMVDRVATIESNPEYYESSLRIIGMGVECRLGESPDQLPGLISHYSAYGPLLLFLDAHWGENNPLIRELEIIANLKIKPVIIIHDFKVPGHPELGYDTYDGQDYEWSWIEKAVDNIYGKDGYTYHYNTQAEGAKRGVIFIEPR